MSPRDGYGAGVGYDGTDPGAWDAIEAQTAGARSAHGRWYWSPLHPAVASAAAARDAARKGWRHTVPLTEHGERVMRGQPLRAVAVERPDGLLDLALMDWSVRVVRPADVQINDEKEGEK